MNEVTADSALAGEILADNADAASDAGHDTGSSEAAGTLKAVGYAAHPWMARDSRGLLERVI